MGWGEERRHDGAVLDAADALADAVEAWLASPTTGAGERVGTAVRRYRSVGRKALTIPATGDRP